MPEKPIQAAPVVAAPVGAVTMEHWRSIVTQVRASSPRHGTALAYGRFLGATPDAIRIGFTRDTQFHKAAIASESGRPLCEAAAARVLGRPMRILLEEAPAGAGPSLAEEESLARSSREQDATRSAHNHPAVRAVLRLLGGEVEHVQVLEAVRPQTEVPLDEEVTPS